MAVSLYLSPDNQAALAHLQALVERVKAADPLAPVWVLLPRAQIAHRLRRHLGDTFNLHIFQFYGLAQVVLHAIGQEPIHEIHSTAARRLVHTLLRSLHQAGQLSTFAPVWDKPGFTDVVLAWLREMKTQGILPREVAREARRTGTERDRQLALLYQEYQRFLQEHRLSDADGLLWLAADQLAQQPGNFRQEGPLFVYGFDQFSPVEMALLAGLAPCFDHLHLYLLWDPDRPASSLALTRLDATRRQILAQLAPQQVQTLPATPRPHAVTHLRAHLFEPQAKAIAPGPDLVLVEAPSREAEVRAALRAIKKLLLDGVPPQAIALLAPRPGAYGRLVETVAQEYGVPVAVESTLATNPAVAALLNALSLWPDFPWRQTFDLLRSPYVDVSAWLGETEIDLLDQLTRERPVIAGLSQWHHALRPLTLSLDDGQVDDEDRSEPPLVARLAPEILAALRSGLDGLFQHLTPPAQGTHADYALWLQTAILGLFPEENEPQASLHLLTCCRQGPYPDRDLDALSLALHSLRQLIAAVALTGAAPGEPPTVTWEEFRRDLREILPAVPVLPPGGDGQVRFDTLESVRGLTPDYLFVLGLSEGEFPTPPPPDVLYAAHERRDAGIPLRRPVPGEEATLWWQAVSNVGQRLTLLRPWLDDRGEEWPPSPYWQAVVDLFAPLTPVRIPVAAPPPLEEAASPEELAVVLARAGARQVPEALAPLWRWGQQGHWLWQQRESPHPGPFQGVIQAADLQEELAHRYGPEHIWSASRLNQYHTCPFGFFARQVLGLTPRPDPEEGLDARQRGSLLHAILERLYRRLCAEETVPTPATQAQVLACLDACCTEIFQDAPQRYGFRPSPLWHHEQAEIRRQLAALLRWECQENGDRPGFHPFQQELAFGTAGGYPPAHIADGDGRAIRLRGIIDRIDRDEDGRLRIIDYKSGSTRYNGRDIEEGRAVQVALYALAAEQLFGEGVVVESIYLHIPTRELSGRLDFAQEKARSTLAAACRAVSQAAEAASAGHFPNLPSRPVGLVGTCADWCDLADLCQVPRHGRFQRAKVQ
ncbi:PD-(D/E)XK nuclease family protein [Litorilinea aerophila]|uniref:Uncharacterized protein n=1 Tax=Litorilinea aerophila TaxID=1204385 RepID=A0A540VMR1_9CHLR|nr:PD-(D/E)XK nuclease family protein [Litorilinea aerophila]